MRVVSVTPYPLKLNVVALLNTLCRLNYDPNNIIIQQHTSGTSPETLRGKVVFTKRNGSV